MDNYIKANIILSKFCKEYMELKKDLPIRPSEMGLLNIIVLRKGRFTPVMLAELLGVSKPMITAHITALEKKEYIKKEYSKEDKRSFYVVPTDKAKKLVEKSAETTKKHLIYLEKELGSDAYEKLLSVLCDTNKILTNMRGDNL
ncbi:MAG: MarR family transcriptional regulator [Clostridia bacterium]|nr:MarR family transcriptional regulator [Clostridia bacterium]